METPMILESVDVLKRMIHPEWFDGRPGQPGPLKPAVADFLVSEIVRDVAANLKKTELATKLRTIGKELATQASKNLVQAYDEGDDWCGNGRFWWLLHHRPPFPPGPDPGPDPVYRQFMTQAMNDILLAHVLREVAQLIVKNAASTMYEEYCKTQFRAPKPVARAA